MDRSSRVEQVLGADGKGLILAMDHGRLHGAIQGLERPQQLLEGVLEAGIDAVLANFGMLKHYRELFADRAPVIMRIDGGETLWREEWLQYDRWRALFTVDDAVRAGADGVAVMTFIGGSCELDTLEITSRAAADAQRAGVPVMAEALPVDGPHGTHPTHPEAMADAARIAFEHGADLVKNYYTGSEETYRPSVASCPAPVLVAGGERMDTAKETLEAVSSVMQAGGAGAVVGRNIWQHPDPVGMTRALAAVVHEGAEVGDAHALVSE